MLNNHWISGNNKIKNIMFVIQKNLIEFWLIQESFLKAIRDRDIEFF